jgi:hypothetical protein
MRRRRISKQKKGSSEVMGGLIDVAACMRLWDEMDGYYMRSVAGLVVLSPIHSKQPASYDVFLIFMIVHCRIIKIIKN